MVMTGVEISLLDVKKLSYLLVEGYWQVSVVDEIDSTQTYLAQKNKVHGEVISAEYQSAGRGRRAQRHRRGRADGRRGNPQRLSRVQRRARPRL